MQHICMHEMSRNYLRRGCAYLLGLLAMIKCSICSYQCDNWYDSNMSLWLSHYFSWGSAFLSLLRGLQMLPCALHKARSSSPFGVIKNWRWQNTKCWHVKILQELEMQTCCILKILSKNKKWKCNRFAYPILSRNKNANLLHFEISFFIK
jgi:hypothetical protein